MIHINICIEVYLLELSLNSSRYRQNSESSSNLSISSKTSADGRLGVAMKNRCVQNTTTVFNECLVLK
jgi:hypothetical protein